MEFQEYPKSLYMKGDRKAEHVIVGNKEEEEARRAEGYKMISEVEGPAGKKGK